MSKVPELDAPDGKHAYSHVPADIHGLALYFHSLTEIWEYYRALGNNPPAEFGAEMARAEHAMIQALKNETNQGGSLHHYYKNVRKGKYYETGSSELKGE